MPEQAEAPQSQPPRAENPVPPQGVPIVENPNRPAPITELVPQDNNPRFDAMPESVKKPIRIANHYLANDPRGLNLHAIEGLIKDIAGAEPPSGDKTSFNEVTQEALRKLQQVREEVESREFTKGKFKNAESLSQAEASTQKYEQLMQEAESISKRLMEKGKTVDSKKEATAEESQRKGRSIELQKLAEQTRRSNTQGAQPTPEALEKLKNKLKDITKTQLSPEDKELVDSLASYLNDSTEYIKLEEQVGGINQRGSELNYNTERFYSHENLEFISKTLSKPERVLQMNDEQLELFRNDTVRVFNIIFRNADLNTDQPFQVVFNSLQHQPVAEDILSMVNEIEMYALEEGKDPSNVHAKNISNKMKILRTQLAAERTLRQYAHNAAYILQVRRPLEELAGFAEGFTSGELDNAFKENPLVITACHLIEQKTNQALTDNNWTVPQLFMQLDPSQGGVRLDNEVIEMLRTYAGDKYQDWEIQRSYRIAKGLSLGATAVILDRLAEADAPSTKTHGAYRGYYGESILNVWNPMRHFFVRWGQPNEMHNLMYSVIREYGTLMGWNHEKLKEYEETYKNLKGSEKVEKLLELGGTPLIEHKNLLNVGGPFTRGGWRLDAATYGLLKTKHGAEEIPELDELQIEYMRDHMDYDAASGVIKNLKGIDWEASWKEFKRAGSGIMYHWIGGWTSAIAGEEADTKGLVGHEKDEYVHRRAGEIRKELKIGPEENKKTLDRLVFEHIRDVNPLKFAYFEKEDMHNPEKFANSLRGMAIQAVFPEITSIMVAPSKVMRVEEDLQLVQEKALQRAREIYDVSKGKVEAWGVTEEDFDILQDPAHPEIRKNAHTYWIALKNAIDTKKFPVGSTKGTLDKLLSSTPGKVKYGDAVDFFSSTTKDRGFFIGTEDLDFSRLEFKYAGASMIGRVFKDAHTLSAGASGIFGFADVIKHAAVSGDYNGIIEAIEKITHPVESVHGSDAASKLTYKLATMTARYFQKDWRARLPLGIGTVIDTLTRDTALSKELGGKQVWRWDEEKSYAFIEDLFKHRMLTDEDRSKLKKEIGGTEIQMGIDMLRSVIPLVLFLVMLQAAQAELKESNHG
jgi:hypothetical protein